MRILVFFCMVIAMSVAEPQSGRRRTATPRRIPGNVQRHNTKTQKNTGKPVLNKNVLLPGAFKPVGQIGSFELGTLGTLTFDDQSIPTISDNFMNLLPKFRVAIDGLNTKESLSRPSEMMQAFFPMIRQVMEAIATTSNRSLTTEEESNLDLTETVMSMSVGVMDDLMSSAYATDVKKAIFSILNMTRPIVEAWAKREERPVTQEETVFLYYFENSFKYTIDTIEEFAKVSTPESFVKASSEVAKFFLSSRANAEGRKISSGETALIKTIEDEVLTNINIMRGFSNFTNTDELIDAFMLLVEYIMDHNANRELPKRTVLNFQEKQLLKSIETALQEGASLLNDLHDGLLSVTKITNLNKETRRLWEEEAKLEERELTVKELEYLDFMDKILATVKLMYKAW
ncbi:unnamed protein product [Meganyctiphanes norvegica]|uniref:Uncharacterized protein n=1 Tax=Meganyctiphanes norvegica TaxID=48144 RepID=A0AAV2STA0_MEGNR